MPKVKISEFDIDPANNTDINNINIAEGCAPSGINNAIRQLMSDLKEFQTGAGGDPFNGAVNGTVGATTPATGAFTTLSASSTATLNTLSSSGATITGGSINGTTVGASTASTGAFTSLSASGAFSANGGTTLGDASGDALTINSSAVSIPNGLNFDSNTFVIDATNNRVGVGTASPARKFHVAEGASFSITGLVESASTGGASLSFKDANTTNDTQVRIGSVGNNAVMFAGGAECMRITSSGNVGIGNTVGNYRGFTTSTVAIGGSQSGELNIVRNTTSVASLGAIAWIKENAPTTVNGERALGVIETLTNSTGSTSGGNMTFSTKTEGGTTPTERMRLDASGNLGLGVTPSAWSGYGGVLELKNAGVITSTASIMEIGANYYFNGTNAIYKTSSTATYFQQNGGQFRWYNAPSGTAGNAITFTQAMTLDANGRRMLGTTTASVASGYITDTINGTSGSYTEWQQNGSNTFRVGSDASSGGFLFTQAATPIRFGTNGSERMRIDSSGNLLVGKTSATANGGDIQVSKGITFPATQSAQSDANTLDDYEEGTWTPVLAWSTPGTSTITPTSATGQYTKIGNMVYCAFNFDNATFTNGTATGFLVLSGLPFTSSSSSATAYWGGSITTNIGFPTNTQNVLVDTNATTATFKKSDGSSSNVVVADVSGSSKFIRATFIYRV
jgi:hypothetical protein